MPFNKSNGEVMSLTRSLIDKIVSVNRLQKDFLESAVSSLSADDTQLLEEYIAYCADSGITLTYLAESYDTCVKDTLREQIYFKKHGKYRYSRYAEVAKLVYDNHSYMNKYMQGLALTYFFWPNHVTMRRYFKKSLPKVMGGKYIEIGPGHGFYFMQAMRHTKYDRFIGLDISATSVMMTRMILESGHFGRFTDYEIVQCDFLAWEAEGTYDAVVMGEVLEHVERPADFMRKIRDIAHPDTYIYITTCINAPAIDHIYQFRSLAEIDSLVQGCGLYVKECLTLPYNELSLEQSEREELPVNVALLLGRSDE